MFIEKIMTFLKTISRLVASENLPVTWTTPLGFPVQMMCYKKESKRVKTKMGDSIVKLSIASETDEIDKRKTAQSVCPNFIHSFPKSYLQVNVYISSFCFALNVTKLTVIWEIPSWEHQTSYQSISA